MTLSRELTEIDADRLPDIAARGRDILMQRAATLGPETGKDGDDLALASTYEGAYSPRTLGSSQQRYVKSHRIMVDLLRA